MLLVAGFIDFIVTPAFDVCSELLDVILGSRPPHHSASDLVSEDESIAKEREERPWLATLSENRKNWRELCLASPKSQGDQTI